MMRRLLVALTVVAAACGSEPAASRPDAAQDDVPGVDVAPVDAAPLCAVGITERCDSECLRGTGYRRCVEGPAWSQCFCEEADAGVDASGPDDVAVGDAPPEVATPDAVSDAVAVGDAPPDTCSVMCGGQCVDMGFDPMNCGRCGVVCRSAIPHVAPGCSAGRCVTPCATGWGDCDGREANGCEVDLRASDRANCGYCGRACTGLDTCMMGVCRH